LVSQVHPTGDQSKQKFEYNKGDFNGTQVKLAVATTGQKGETLAAAYLRQRGYEIVGTNWRCSRGEIDIIARAGETLVFVEVRTRHADTTAEAFESVSVRKQNRMQVAVHLYLAEHELENVTWRIDVIAIALPRVGKPLIEQVEDALDW
jgi:putative endonuclease